MTDLTPSVGGTVGDIVEAARRGISEAKGSAKGALRAVEGETEHATKRARSVILDGIQSVAGIVTMLRTEGADDALRWAGLQRRRGPIEFAATFGAGIALGAFAALLLAPKSGEETRKALADALDVDKFVANARRALSSEAHPAVATTKESAAHAAA